MATNFELIPFATPQPLRPTENMGDMILAGIPPYALMRPDLLATCVAIQAIADDETEAIALRYAGNIKAEIKSAEEHFKPYVTALNEVHKRAVAMRDGVLAPLNREVNRLKVIDRTYNDEKERRAREDRARLEREARERAEAERRRIEEEAQAEAELLAAEGRNAEAETVMEEAIAEIEAVQAEPIIIPAATIQPASVTGASYRSVPQPVYRDLDETIRAAAREPDLHRKWLTWDLDMCGRTVRAQGTMANIPGVDVMVERIQSIRASK